MFSGRFDLADVEAVPGADPLAAWDCLVVLDLVERSLVVFDGEHTAWLATVAAFAGERIRGGRARRR